jgi:hypothetical protein
MQHITQQDLTLYYYGEAECAAEIEHHIDSCQMCRSDYEMFQRVLNSVDMMLVPERPPDYEERLWRELAPTLANKPRWRWRDWSAPRQWTAAAVALLLLAAYLVGRGSHLPAPTGLVTQPGPIRERLLVVAVGDHLERSQLVLAELANADPRRADAGGLDISFEQRAAEDLIETNRLYRQTADLEGDISTANVLEDLERVLLEIANSPPTLSTRQLEDLKRQIADRGILFKVRIVGSDLRHEPSGPAPAQRKPGTL